MAPTSDWKRAGELIAAYGLGDESSARTVRVRHGVPAVTDGPYIEAREFVSSFCLLEADSEARALELDHIAPNPMATLNRALAVAMVHGPGAGLDLLATLDDDDRVAGHHRLYAMRGHLLEMAGDRAAAREAFQAAAHRTASLPEKRYLLARAGPPADDGPAGGSAG